MPEGTQSNLAKSMTDAARRSARASEQFVDAAAHAMDSGSQASAEGARSLEDQAGRLFGGQAFRSGAGVKSAGEVSHVLLNGAQDIAGEWLAVLSEGYTRNVNRISETARGGTAPDLVQLQLTLMRENWEGLIDGMSRLTNVSLRVANQTVRAFGSGSGSEDHPAPVGQPPSP